MGSLGIENPDFGKRLEHLMAAAGFDVSKKGTDGKLSREMHSKGCLPIKEKSCIDMDDEKDLIRKSIEHCRKIIETHRKRTDPPSTEWIMAYCQFFKCSADYLLGYIPAPTHESVTAQAATGLSEESVSVLMKFSKMVRAMEDWRSKNNEYPSRDLLHEERILKILNYLIGGELYKIYPKWKEPIRMVHSGMFRRDFGLLMLIYKYVVASQIRSITGTDATEEDGRDQTIKPDSIYFRMEDGEFEGYSSAEGLYKRSLLDRIRDELERLRSNYMQDKS